MQTLVAALVLVMLGLGSMACAGDNGDNTGVLADVKKRGTLRVATDPANPPQSSQDSDGAWSGFDADTARGVAEQLNVTAEFVVHDFSEVVAGGWDGAWDVAIESVTITAERQAVLTFSEPYYYVSAYFGVKTDGGIATTSDLDGKTICVVSATTYESFLSGTLTLPSEDINGTPPADVAVLVMSTDGECAEAIDDDEADALLTSDTSLTELISGGAALTRLDAPMFIEENAVALDSARGDDNTSLLAAVNEALRSLRDSGDLATYSEDNFGIDATQPPSR